MYPKNLPINRPGVPIEEACVNMANLLIVACKLRMPKMVTISNISSHFFASVYEELFGPELKDSLTQSEYSKLNRRKEAHMVQRMIDKIADFMQVHLDHISGSDIAARNPLALSNFLEIILAYYEIVVATSKPRKELPKVLKLGSFSTSQKEIGRPHYDLSKLLDKFEKLPEKVSGGDSHSYNKLSTVSVSSSSSSSHQCSIYIEKLNLNESDPAPSKDPNLDPWSPDNSPYWQMPEAEHSDILSVADLGLSPSMSQALSPVLSTPYKSKDGSTFSKSSLKEIPDDVCTLPHYCWDPKQGLLSFNASNSRQGDPTIVKLFCSDSPPQVKDKVSEECECSRWPILREQIIINRPKKGLKFEVKSDITNHVRDELLISRMRTHFLYDCQKRMIAKKGEENAYGSEAEYMSKETKDHVPQTLIKINVPIETKHLTSSTQVLNSHVVKKNAYH